MESEEQADGPRSEHEERRASPRLAVEEPAAIVILNQGVGFRCSVLDLSLLGCRLRTGLHFPGSAWDSVEVSFALRGIALRLSGEIQWIDGRQKIGIRFLNLTARRRVELATVLAEVKALHTALIVEEAAEPGLGILSEKTVP